MLEYPTNDPLQDLADLLNNYAQDRGIWFACMHKNGEFIGEGIRVAIGVPSITPEGTELRDVIADTEVTTKTSTWHIPFKFTSYCEDPAYVHAMNWTTFMSTRDFRRALQKIGFGFNRVRDIESFIEVLENRSFNTTRFVLDLNVSYRVSKQIRPTPEIGSVLFTIERVN
jgi:hypothetical protein